ncbi:hypothetical protein C0J52_11181 [Blattella germanica]|nr:hypothetical protein C0J52_11181 [Blattella germanica]
MRLQVHSTLMYLTWLLVASEVVNGSEDDGTARISTSESVTRQNIQHEGKTSNQLQSKGQSGSRQSRNTGYSVAALRKYIGKEETSEDNTISEDEHMDSPYSWITTVMSTFKQVLGECAENTDLKNISQQRLTNCLKHSVIKHAKPMLHANGTKMSVLNGIFEIERNDGVNFTLGGGYDHRVGRNDKEAADPEAAEGEEEEEDEEEKKPEDYLAEFERLSKRLTFRVKILPGLILRMGRKDDGFKVGMELDESDFADLEGRGGAKKKLKKLRKFLPLLLIPIGIQFLFLPMVLYGLKIMATKALLAGKLALVLVLLNSVWGALMPQHEDLNTKMANDVYGYDGGMEYGAFINNRRTERDRAIQKKHLAYRGHR